jgi:hypothetical protein
LNKFLILSVFTAIVFVLSFPIHDAHAVAYTATQSGNWNDSATWGLSVGLIGPPTTISSGDTVTIPSGLTVTIHIGNTITNSGTISNSGTFTKDDGSTIINYPGATITNSGTISITGIIINKSGGTITNSGTINNIAGGIVNFGTIINSNTINNDAVTGNYGTIINSGTINNTGFIHNFCSSTIIQSGSVSGKPIINLCGPLQSTQNLIGTISTMKLSQDTTHILDAKVTAIITSINSGACNMAQIHLNAFINDVNAQQTNNNITSKQAGKLISDAQNIINSFAC